MGQYMGEYLSNRVTPSMRINTALDYGLSYIIKSKGRDSPGECSSWFVASRLMLNAQDHS
jgi:hypothetical protein